MKTNNIIQKLSVIASIFLITFYLVNAQKADQKKLKKETQAVAYLNAGLAVSKDKSYNLDAGLRENKRNMAAELDKISDALLEKQGLKFDVKKTITVSSLGNEMNTETNNTFSAETLNDQVLDSELHFDLSKTISVTEANKEFNKIDITLNDPGFTPAENNVKFDVSKTISVCELQNDFEK